MHRKVLWCLLSVSLLMLSVAPLALAERTFTHAIEYRVFDIDPSSGQMVDNTIVTGNTYEGLLTWDLPAMLAKSALAEDWEISVDGTACTFYLRRGVKFHDGTNFDSAAVQYSWERMNGINAGPAQMFLRVAGLEVIDQYTVRFTSDSTFAFWENAFAGFDGFRIVSPAAANAHKTADDPWAQAWLAENVVGTGPYMMTEHVLGQYVILDAFADYWGGWEDDQFDKVVLRIMTEPAARGTALLAGEVTSSTSVSNSLYPTIEANPNYTVYVTESSSIQTIYLQCHQGPLANKMLRKAIAYAVDYDAVRQCMRYSVEPCGPLASWLPGASTDCGCIQDQDLEMARYYMDLAGVAPGELEIAFSIVLETDFHECLGLIVQQNLGDIGIKVNLEPKGWPDFFAESKNADISNVMSTQYGAAQGAEPYDVMLLNYGDKSALDPNYGFNNGYVNPLVSGWIDQLAKEPDRVARAELAFRASEILVEDAGFVWLFTVPYVVVMRNDITGYQGIPINRALVLFHMLHQE